MQVVPTDKLSENDRQSRDEVSVLHLDQKLQRPLTDENNENKSDRSQLKDEADQSKLPLLPCCQCLSEGSGCCTSFACQACQINCTMLNTSCPTICPARISGQKCFIMMTVFFIILVASVALWLLLREPAQSSATPSVEVMSSEMSAFIDKL